jgi:hypothetical protein
MKSGSGKKKGSAFEREVAKLIVRAFSKHEIKQRECWRSCLSGGHEMSCGDLYLSDRLAKLFPWAVECKFYRKILWQNFLMDPESRKKSWKELQWLKQAEDAVAAKPGIGLEPLLVMKENRGPIYAMWRNGSGEIRLKPFRDFLRKVANDNH